MSETEENDQMGFPPGAATPLYILAPFVPTPPEVIDQMLRLSEVTSQDIVYDLGCGDGRIIIAAAKQCGARGVGVDIEAYRVAESQANARAAGVAELATFRHQDAMTVDLSDATVVMVYLVHWSTEKLRPVILKTARPGTRVISHNFPMGEWIPTETEEFKDDEGDIHTLYLWIVGITV